MVKIKDLSVKDKELLKAYSELVRFRFEYKKAMNVRYERHKRYFDGFSDATDIVFQHVKKILKLK